LLSLGVFLLGETRVERSSSHHSGLKFSPRKAQPAFCRRKATGATWLGMDIDVDVEMGWVSYDGKNTDGYDTG